VASRNQALSLFQTVKSFQAHAHIIFLLTFYKSGVYKLTAAGRRQLAAETETWERFSEAIGLILQNT
jgi:hypothetical protein